MQLVKETARSVIQSRASDLVALSHELHDLAETGFSEHHSARLVSDVLRQIGFTVSEVEGLPTAFVARHPGGGEGRLSIGICAEYDALNGIGHACGHNIIAASAVGAAAGLAAIAEELDLDITVLGTPAEEGGAGKVLMLRSGCFDDLHMAMMVHPSPIERDEMATLAVSQLFVRFHGRAAHAAVSPERGVNAAAAMTLAQTGIALLREHFHATDRVHGIVDGGEAPNVVPSKTTGRWYVRASSLERLAELEPRIVKVFEGAAMMTGCSVEIEKEAPTYADLRTDLDLADRWRANSALLGRSSLTRQPGDGAASTDMGNVSHALPSLHPLIAIDSDGADLHEPAFADAAKSTSGDSAIVDGAVAMAWTAIDVAIDSLLRARLQTRTYRVADVRPDERAYLDL